MHEIKYVFMQIIEMFLFVIFVKFKSLKENQLFFHCYITLRVHNYMKIKYLMSCFV